VTISQRRLLEKFAAGDKPLNRAIAAALYDLDRLHGEAEEAGACPECKGLREVFYALHGMATCSTCRGTGRKP
jgi:hypothetical protein